MAKFVYKKDGKKVKVIGHDVNDPRPVEVSSGLKRPETQDERIRRIIKEQIRPQDHGFESDEDAEDFDIEDDFEGELPISEDEFVEMRAEYPIVNEIMNPTGSPDESDKGGPAPASVAVSDQPDPDPSDEDRQLDDRKE